MSYFFFYLVCFANEREVKIKFISNLVEIPGEGVARSDGPVNKKFHDYIAEYGSGRLFY